MQHLAIIPDGNRRWAKKNKLKSFFGHKKGMESFRMTVRFCLKKGIKYLSFYTFSLENFNRPEEEKNYLFKLLMGESIKQLPELKEQGVKIRFIGDKNYFPKNVLTSIKKLEEETKQNNKLNVNLLFCYGAQREIVHATKKLAEEVKKGALKLEEINEQVLENSLWTAGMPNPDLIIRTSKRARLSNFLLYQAAYSEFMFLDIFWPEIKENHLECCLNEFKGIQRNFGR
ncbi:di-trans,poly-cis-decaprenylcistransferase [Candidatus Dependentiae bacterium]|nr:di-trans,poly-cis-decaprenylcistransferase [Candidatus Dependentiae bacterium]